MHGRIDLSSANSREEERKKKGEVTLGKLTICVTTNTLTLSQLGCLVRGHEGWGLKKGRREHLYPGIILREGFPTHC